MFENEITIEELYNDPNWFEDWLETLSDEDIEEILLDGQEAGIGLLCGDWG